jgi:CheY-like chemotaxis protein
MPIFGSHHEVTVVRGAGTAQETRWDTRAGGDLSRKMLFYLQDRVKTGDEIHSEVFDEPRVIVRVDPALVMEGVSHWEATIVPRSRSLHRHGSTQLEFAGSKGMSTPRIDVFLACTPGTREQVTLIAGELDRRGLTHWLGVLDRGHQNAWKDAIPQALQLCRTCAIFVCSRLDSPLRNEQFCESLADWLRGGGGRTAFPVVLPGPAIADFTRIHASAIWLSNGIADRHSIDCLCAAVRAKPLGVFLCHASDDKREVRELHSWLTDHGFIPWLDERDILPGQDWREAISSAVRASDVVLVCLSPTAVTKSGYVQRELREALDVADEQPDGTIFLIPTKLMDCEVPSRLQRWQWVELHKDGGHDALLASLQKRAASGRYGRLKPAPIQNVEELYQWESPSNAILIVDDNRDLLHFLERLLSVDWTVLTADSAAATRSIAKGKVLEGIVVDYMLPDGNGVELLLELLESNPRAVPLLITGTILPPKEEGLCAQKQIPVLRKPFLASDVSKLISAGSERRPSQSHSVPQE